MSRQETRWYIGMQGGARMSAKCGPGAADNFSIPPYRPIPLPDGEFLYQVSEQVAAEFMAGEE